MSGAHHPLYELACSSESNPASRGAYFSWFFDPGRTRRCDGCGPWSGFSVSASARQLCYDQQLYGESITRSYYACYQALWATVGDPALGLWRHGGLINEFCRGRWTTPTLLPMGVSAHAG